MKKSRCTADQIAYALKRVEYVTASQSIRMEGGWTLFRDVALQIESELRPWEEVSPWGSVLGSQGWDVWGFWGFGKKLEENCARFPACAHLLETTFPGMTMGGFSRLRGGGHILPHNHKPEGFFSSYKTFHLGLIVPPGCGFRVEGLHYEWKEGEAFCFDASKEHEAWNRGKQDRIIVVV